MDSTPSLTFGQTFISNIIQVIFKLQGSTSRTTTVTWNYT